MQLAAFSWFLVDFDDHRRQDMMRVMVLKDDFDTAVAKVNGLPQKPAQDRQLDLYSLFKQATKGDVSGKRPGMLDMVGRAKYDAWAKRKGMSSEDAMNAYIAMATQLTSS